MASFLYKDLLIVILAIHEKLTDPGFLSLILVGEPMVIEDRHKITSPPNHFKNWPDAETNMLELAKAWIDDHA